LSASQTILEFWVSGLRVDQLVAAGVLNLLGLVERALERFHHLQQPLVFAVRCQGVEV